MARYLEVLVIILIVWTITDCLSRRENRFWILVVLFFPIVGSLLYFAWTRNWMGKTLGARMAAAPGAQWDVVAEGTPADLQRKGAQLLRRGKFNEAVETLETLLAREGPAVPPAARYDVAVAYKELGRFRDARDQLRLVVGADPRFHTGLALLELADCYEQMNEEDEARKTFERLLAMVNLPEARYRYGLLLDKAGEKEVAVNQMRRILDELDKAPDFHRQDNRRFAKLAREYLRKAEA